MNDTPALPTVPVLTDEQRDAVLRTIAELGAVAQAIATAFVQAVIPAVQAAAQQLAALHRQMQDAGLLDADGKPVRAADRPAWQSPYGPPTRRH
ncbi:hypothetical protein ACWEO1_22690 [Kitasatospora cineracea]